MPSLSELSLLKELDLLVGTGLGIAQIAPALSNLLSKIIGADANGMCWFDDTGTPQGFYQRGAGRKEEELFMNHYEELFIGPHEYTPFWTLHNKGRSVGNSLVSKEYFRSNTYNLLIKPTHCHFLLDTVVELDGVPRFTACLFRSVENPFTSADVQKLTALVPVLRRAVVKRPSCLVGRGRPGEDGHLLVSGDGQQIEMIDLPAQKLLTTTKLFDQNVSLTDVVAQPPRFVQLLCERLLAEPITDASAEIDVAGGSLLVRANWLADTAVTSSTLCTPKLPVTATPCLSAKNKILVSLQFRQSSAVEVVQTISAWGLSPLQARIAMYAASGGCRTGCAVHHKVSKEALKKHLNRIYAASCCTDWQELSQKLTAN